ncbi:MAG: ThuA domain-containing protein [Gemmataceae bacterium]|nr:ThuA domain-containing protein [Gemmataceae bacterium]
MCRRVLSALAVLLCFASLASAQAPKLKLLFLGDNGGHRPHDRYRQLQPVLADRGIELIYTDTTKALNAETLSKYDGLVIYANTTEIDPAAEKALLDYVASGKGLIPLHCASYCFLNSPKYIELVGAQFQRHDTGTFRTILAERDHPIMKGFGGFESWDETYVHTKHNPKDRTVLEYRTEKKGKEPWTWVRTHEKGRVFYTAWGHDQRTWAHAGFHNLVERGIRWACGGDPAVVPAFFDRPEMTSLPKDVKPFEYIEGAKIPFYSSNTPGQSGKALSKMQKALPAEESMKHMVHPSDFDLKLVATDPIIKRPICINWDERGRLWIAETIDYPNELKRDGQGRDRIVICEDTDGDGVIDKTTVFADKLSIPTSFTFARGGVIVHQAPHTLLLKDTDGDGVADERKILFTGWSTGDTHAGPSNLTYGLDNWLYGMVGYAGFKGEVGGESHDFRTGFYRLKPDGSKIEFLRNTNNNSWGVGFSEEGHLFGSTANGTPSVYLPIPNRYYESVRGWSSAVLSSIAVDNFMHPITDRVRQVDWHGKFTAGAGHSLYTARTYPQAYWNRTAFVNEPTGHLTATFTIQKNGTDFVSRNSWNLLASDDEWCSPIVAEVGPDGCMWVVDWYNFIVQHNPTPAGFKNGKGNAYETELRDKTHGRVYRLVPKDGKVGKTLDLSKATPKELVATLKNDNLFWRRHAQRLLVERGDKDVVPDLIALLKDESVDAIGLNTGVIHALWTLKGLGELSDQSEKTATLVAKLATQHRSAAVRRASILVMPTKPAISVLDDVCSAQELALQDSDPHVRLAALLTIADMPADFDMGTLLANFTKDANNMSDRWLPDALVSAAARHDLDFICAVALGVGKTDGKAGEVVAIVAEHFARAGNDKNLSRLIFSLELTEPKVVDVIISAFSRGWSKNTKAKLGDLDEKALERLLNRVDPATRPKLLRVGINWGSTRLEKYMGEILVGVRKTLEDDKASEKDRLGAARQLVELRPDDAKESAALLELLTPRTSPTLAAGIVDILGNSASAANVASLAAKLPSLPPSVRVAALRSLLSRPESTKLVLDALDKGTVQLAELSLDQRQALASSKDKQIAVRAKKILERGGGLPSADRQKVIDELEFVVKKAGDAPKGKEMFKKHCAVCHMHSGEGAKVGPDLTGMAAHPKHELLIHLMDPSRSVEGNFRLYQLVLEDGRTLQGMLASETKTSLELIDAQAKKHVIQRADVEQIIATTKSLMPEGFEKQMKPEEVGDLLEFLTQRGKFLPLPLAKAATVVSTKNIFFGTESQLERMILSDWNPREVKGVPFHFVDPQGDRTANLILLYGPNGNVPPKMPKSVKLPCNAPAKAVHLLSGVSGWGHPGGKKGSVSMIVRLHYADGKTENHPLLNGEHFADYIGRVDVPKSDFAFSMRSQQMRYLRVVPERNETITEIEFVKGTDGSAPLVLAVTVEAPEPGERKE